MFDKENIPDVVRGSVQYKERLKNYYIELPAKQFLAQIPNMTRRMLEKEEIQLKLTNSVEYFLYNEVPMASSQV